MKDQEFKIVGNRITLSGDLATRFKRIMDRTGKSPEEIFVEAMDRIAAKDGIEWDSEHNQWYLNKKED